MKVFFITISILVYFSCSADQDTNSPITNDFSIIDEVVKEYISEYRRLNDLSRDEYFNVNFSSIGDSTLLFSIFVSSRPIEIRQMPFRFKQFDVSDFDNYAFYYSNEINPSNSIKEELSQKGLLLRIKKDGGLPAPDIGLGEWYSWHCVMCKKDLNHYTIIKSNYVFSPNDIPSDFNCPTR